MAPDKQLAHQLLEQLDPSQLAAVVQLLEVMTDPLARSLANAAVDDEPVSAEEAAALDEAHASIARGEGIPHEEFSREWASTNRPHESEDASPLRDFRLGPSLCKFRFQVRSVALRQPEEQFVSVHVPDDKSRRPPMKEVRLYAFCADVLAQYRCLVVFKTDKSAAMSCAVFGPILNLIEDELESKQTDLKNERAAFDLMIPISR